MLLQDDPRWRRLNDHQTPCACCGQTFSGLPVLGFIAPCIWPTQPAPVDNKMLDPMAPDEGEAFLSQDFCILEGSRLVRAVLELPLIGGAGETLHFGVWSTLSVTNFQGYAISLLEGTPAPEGPLFGWFASEIAGFDPQTAGLKCHVWPRPDGLRPFIELEPTSHPLARAQHEGVSLGEALRILAACGHDLRPHLERSIS